jgi:hypothetical protein
MLLMQRAIAYKDSNKFDEMAADATMMTTIGDGMGYKLLAQVAEANDDCIKSIQLHTHMMDCFPESDELSTWQATRAQRLFRKTGQRLANLSTALNDLAEATVNKQILIKNEN